MACPQQGMLAARQGDMFGRIGHQSVGLSSYFWDPTTYSTSHAQLLMHSFCSDVWLCLQRSTGASWMRDPKGMLFVRLIEAVNGEAPGWMGATPSDFYISKIRSIIPKERLAVLLSRG